MAHPSKRTVNALPRHHVSISDTPSLHGMGFKVYPHGLEMVRDGTRIFMSGLATFMALVFLFVASDALHSIAADGPGPFSVTIAGLMLFFAYALLRWDTFGYRYCPILYDRAARKVHVFSYHTRLLSPWPIVGGKYEIHSFDWDCVRAVTEHYMRKEIINRWGTTVERPAVRLWLMVVKAPDDPTIVHPIDTGLENDARLGHRLLDTWEHLRRYMQHEGPPLVEGDTLYQPSQISLWASLTIMQPFVGPGAKKNWQTRNEVKWLSQIMWLVQIVATVLFPITMAWGLLRWVLFRIKPQPKWPAAILASVGGSPLQGEALARGRNVMPVHGTGT